MATSVREDSQEADQRHDTVWAFGVQAVLDVLSDSEVRFSAAHWRELGGRLKPDLDLEAIEAQYSKLERRLEEVIGRWDRDGNDPSWETLADAVSKCKEGGGKNMAAKIRKKVGLVPIKPDSQLQSATTAPSIPAGPTSNDRQGQGMELRQQSSESDSGTAFGSEGRRSVSSPPVSPLSSFNSSKGIPTVFFSEEDVRSKVEYFSQRFNEMSDDAREALEENEIPPKRVVYFLKMPDPYFKTREEHMEFLDALNLAGDVLDLFISLNSYWDHFNYHLLERLIMAPRIEKKIEDKEMWQKLQVTMKQYVQDLDEFRRRTTLGVYYKVFDKQKKEVPEGFQELVTKHEWSEANTLQDVEDFRQRVAQKYQLHNCLVFFRNFLFSSVVITWWIPRSLVASHPLPEGGLFDDDDGLLTASLGGTIIWMTESQSSQLSEDPPIELEPEDQEPPPAPETATESQVVKSKKSLLSAVRNKNAKAVERLILEGLDPNSSFALGWTPLMEASARGYTVMARLLLEKGANPNLANFEGWTALMAASRRGHFDIVDQLLIHGANPDMQDNSGWSALLAAVYNCREAISLRLIAGGATPHLQAGDGTNAIFLAIILEQPKVIDALLAHNPDLNVQDKYGETVVITAVKKENLKLVQDLLERNADPNILNHDGDSPLLLATERQNIEIVKALLKAGAKPNAGDVPALHLASGMGVMDIVHILLSNGANPAMKDKYGTTAYEIASWKNYTELAEMVCQEKPSESKSPELLQETLQALATIQTQLSRAPLYYLREAKFKAMRTSWIRNWLPRDIIH